MFWSACWLEVRPELSRNAVRKTPRVKSDLFHAGARRAASATTRAAGARMKSRLARAGLGRLGWAGLPRLLGAFAGGAGAAVATAAAAAATVAVSRAALTRQATRPRSSERIAAPTHVACTPMWGRKTNPAASEPVSVPAVFTA